MLHQAFGTGPVTGTQMTCIAQPCCTLSITQGARLLAAAPCLPLHCRRSWSSPLRGACWAKWRWGCTATSYRARWRTSERCARARRAWPRPRGRTASRCTTRGHRKRPRTLARLITPLGRIAALFTGLRPLRACWPQSYPERAWRHDGGACHACMRQHRQARQWLLPRAHIAAWLGVVAGC